MPSGQRKVISICTLLYCLSVTTFIAFQLNVNTGWVFTSQHHNELLLGMSSYLINIYYTSGCNKLKVVSVTISYYSIFKNHYNYITMHNMEGLFSLISVLAEQFPAMCAVCHLSLQNISHNLTIHNSHSRSCMYQ